MISPLILIPILWGLDGISTLFFMKNYQRRFPNDNHWIDIEANPIVRFFWRRFGLMKGMLISMICVMPIIIAVSLVASFERFFFGMAIGMYLLVFMEHFHAMRFIIKKRKI
jgi:hypothetical protein